MSAILQALLVVLRRAAAYWAPKPGDSNINRERSYAFHPDAAYGGLRKPVCNLSTAPKPAGGEQR